MLPDKFTGQWTKSTFDRPDNKKGRHQNMQHTLISINFFNLRDSDRWIRDNRQLSHLTALPIPGFHHRYSHSGLIGLLGNAFPINSPSHNKAHWSITQWWIALDSILNRFYFTGQNVESFLGSDTIIQTNPSRISNDVNSMWCTVSTLKISPCCTKVSLSLNTVRFVISVLTKTG